MKLRVSLPLIAALSALPAAALATAPEPSAKFSRDPTGWTYFLGYSPTSLGNLLTNDSQRIADLHVTSVSPLLFTGTTVTEAGSYAIGWYWFYNEPASALGGLSANGTRRPTLLKGYQNGSQANYAMVMVDNTGSNYRGTWTFADTTLASLRTFLSHNTARIIDMSTWLDSSSVRHYSAIAIYNGGTDYIALPNPTTYPQFLETSPSGLQSFVKNAQTAGVPVRVIDLETEGTGQVLAVIAYDGKVRNTLTNSSAVPPDSWFYPALTSGVGALPEQSLNHVLLSTGGRMVSVTPDVVSGQTDFDVALIEDTPLPAISPLPSPSNDASNQFAYLDNRIQTFMRQYEVTGAAIAVAVGPKLVYTRGFGYSDTELNGGTLATPNTIFRIGSISKLLSTTTILRLIEQGTLTNLGHPLTLDTPVFPEILRPYLGITLASEGTAATTSVSGPGGLENVTVRQVLSHSAGYEDNNCNLGCSGNPLTSTVCIAEATGLTSTPTCAQIIKDYMYNKQLQYVPGSIGKYSNFGFCVAETIVDALTSAGYAGTIAADVFFPLGLWDPGTGNWLFKPASDTYTAAAQEARDYVYPWTGYATSALYPAGQQGVQVDPPYGGTPMFDGLGAGGWKASVTALLKYGVSINQSSPTGQLISGASFASMFAAANKVPAYGVLPCGQSQTPTPGSGIFGLTLEMLTNDTDAWKTGGIAGGGGIMVWSQLQTAYNATTNSCANCITWTALVNTAGNTRPTDGAGKPLYDYDGPGGINTAMIDALAQPSIQSAISAATVDLFPTYLAN